MRKLERIIDENGQVVRETVREIPAYFDEELGYLFWARKNCAKSFQEVPYPAGMSKLDIGCMAILAKKIWSKTNMLGVKGQGGVRPYDVLDIAKVLQMKERQGYRFVKRMLKSGLLAKVRVDGCDKIEVQYYVNPIYWFSGNRIPLNLYLLFREQLDAILPLWVIRRYDSKAEEARERWKLGKA